MPIQILDGVVQADRWPGAASGRQRIVEPAGPAQLFRREQDQLLILGWLRKPFESRTAPSTERDRPDQNEESRGAAPAGTATSRTSSAPGGPKELIGKPLAGWGQDEGLASVKSKLFAGCGAGRRWVMWPR